MDSISFLKLFKLSVADEQQKLEEGEEEEEESFFDLELLSVSAGDIQTPEQRPQIPTTKLADHLNLCPDSISKRKILPIEPTSKPQSPIQLLKSAPKFPVFFFKKQRSMPKNRAPAGAEQREVLSTKISRGNSRRRIGGIWPADPCESPATAKAKRFSKEAMQKYFKMMKPNVLKKPGDGGGDLSSAAVDSPMREKHENGIPAGIRLVCRRLGKSKSASAAGGLAVAPPLNRSDDSLLDQHDGIQSAILHCKKSFNASTDFSFAQIKEGF